MPTRRRKMMLLLCTSYEDLLKALIIILHNLWKKRSKIVYKGGPKSPSHLCNSISYTINYIPPIFCSSILLPSDPRNVVCQTSHLHLKIGPEESIGGKKPNMLPLSGFKPYKATVSSDISSGVSSSPGLLEAALKLF